MKIKQNLVKKMIIKKKKRINVISLAKHVRYFRTTSFYCFSAETEDGSETE